MAQTLNIKQNTIAIAYDFDGTLTPKAMQEYTILPELGIHAGGAFWKKCNQESKQFREEKDLVWMRRIKELSKEKKYKLTKKRLAELGSRIEYYKGVETFFQSMSQYVKKKSRGKMKLNHYIISSGLKEIIDGTTIRNNFKQIFGSQYHYNHLGYPDFPKVLITDTVKTQYIFRINKGKEDVSESINQHMPEEERPIPFKNILFIGDGSTDVPAMNVTKKYGGFALAVYRPGSEKAKKECLGLRLANRVDSIAEADYRKGKEIYEFVTLVLDTMIQRYQFDSRE